MLQSARFQWMILAVLVAATAAANAQEGEMRAVAPKDTPKVPAKQDYNRPTNQKTWGDFVGDTVGPYPLTMAVFTAAIHQATNSPPEWRQGAAGLSKRFGSNMGITAVGNTHALRPGRAPR